MASHLNRRTASLRAPESTQLLITGTPGSLFDLVCDLLARAADQVPGTIARSHCGPNEAWTAEPDAPAGSLHLFITNYPARSYLDAVRDGRLRAVVVIDTPMRCFTDLHEAGHEAIAIVRNLSACATQIGELSASPAACLLGPETRQKPAAALRMILGHAGWLPPLDHPATTPDLGSTELAHGAALADSTSLVREVLGPAFHFAVTGERRAVTWPRFCLFQGDRPDQAAPAVVDLTGPARVIVYGPYFHLAPGRWIATAQMAFSSGACGMVLALEFHGAAPLGRCRFQVERAGVFRVDLPIAIGSASEAIELRLVLQHGAIEGHLGLDDIHLIPADD